MSPHETVAVAALSACARSTLIFSVSAWASSVCAIEQESLAQAALIAVLRGMHSTTVIEAILGLRTRYNRAAAKTGYKYDVCALLLLRMSV